MTDVTPTRRQGTTSRAPRHRRAAQVLRAKPVEIRYRVGRLLGSPSESSAFVSGMREFKTPQAAERAVSEIADEHGASVEQVGILLWMSAEAANAMIETLYADGWEFD